MAARLAAVGCCLACAARAASAGAAGAAAAAEGDAALATAAAGRGRRLGGRGRAAASGLRLAVWPEAAGAALPEIRRLDSDSAVAAQEPPVPAPPVPARPRPARPHPRGNGAGAAAASLAAPAAGRGGGLLQHPWAGDAAVGRRGGAAWPALGTVSAGSDFVSSLFDPFGRNPFDAFPKNPFDTYFKNPYDTFFKNPFDNKTKDTIEPFVHVVMDRSHNGTRVRVDIATPNVIVSVYLLMFVPIVMAWVAMRHYGWQERHYAIILPMTLCSTIVGQDLVNQSLSVLMESPTAITAIQALSMTLVTAVWTASTEASKPTLSLASVVPLAKWSAVALLFALYQLVNHLVSYLCSLSERTVFLNLCPLCSLAVEMTLMPRPIRMQATFSARMSLCAMVLGAVLFSLQYPDFSTSGIVSAVVLVLVLMPYRLLQRWLLTECAGLPVQVLALYDGLTLLVPSCVITAANQEQFWRTWETWFRTPSIALMLALSWMTFTSGHVVTLLMLRAGSATNYLVFHNVAGFILVFEGIVFFGDKVVQAPLVFAGIIISLCSGLWYAIEMYGTRSAKPSNCDV